MHSFLAQCFVRIVQSRSAKMEGELHRKLAELAPEPYQSINQCI